MTSPAAAQGAQPRASLSLGDAVAMIVGIVIGVGIFRAPPIVAGSTGSESVFLALWIAGGVISFVGALCYAELGSAYPNAGGEYFFLRRAFGDWPGFLFAWARMTVIQTGAIAAIAFVVGDYATQMLSLGEKSSAIYAALAVALITGLNVIGTTQSKWLQNTLTLVLALSVLGVVVAGLTAAPAAVAAAPAAADKSVPLFSGLALIFILLTYGGWNEAAYLTAEMRDTRRGIVRALIIGILIITVLYLLLNLAYLNALGLTGMRESKAVATDLMKVTWGDSGALVLGAAVVAAALSTLNATVFTGARTNYALGRDFALFGLLGKWHERSDSPVNALLLQGAIALLLVLLASFTPDGFQTMVAYTAPAFWLFFLLTGISLFVLRRKPPVNADPFRVPLYPLTPILFCAMCVYMLYSSFNYAMSLDPGSIGAIVGIAMLCAGIPVMFAARGTQRQS
ncbi:MAG: APC family permease [Betaproteobacteria bacterium]|nr:APC family permease [Betaproteobacteria bacterium]